MSKTRLLVRLLLLLVLAGMAWVCYQTWQRTRPGYFRKQAESARADGDLDSAKIHLQNLLKRNSQDVVAHVMLADVLLDQAKKEGKPANLASHPEALQEIEAAAKLEPKNPALQKRLLDTYLTQRDYRRAAAAAQVVIEKEPENGGALFALAWRDTRNKKSQAEQWLSRLAGVPNPRAFQTLSLACNYHEARNNTEQLQQALTRTCQLAEQTPVKDFELLTKEDRAILPSLLASAVAQAEDVATAQQRCRQGLAFCQKLAELPDADLNAWGNNASRMVMALSGHAAPADDQEAIQQQTNLVNQAESIRRLAIDAEQADAILYRQSAALAMVQAKVDEALTTARKGLKATEPADVAPPEAGTDEGPGGAGPGTEATEQDGGDEAARLDRLGLHELVARCLLVKGKLKDAAPHIEALIADDATAGSGHLFAGAVASAQGRHAKALGHYRQAERGLGQIQQVRMGLASAYRALNRWQEALPLLKSLQAIPPSNDAEQLALANQLKINPLSLNLAILQAHLALDQWQEAQPSLKALANTPLEPRAVNLAVAYVWGKGQHEEAQAKLAETRSKYPDDVRLLATQAAIWQRLGRKDRAETALKQAAEEHDDSLSHQLLLANWYVALKNPEELNKLLDRIGQAFPESQAPQLLRAQAILRSGDNQQALQLADELSKSPQTKRLGLLVAALAQLNLKNLPEAETKLHMVTEEIDHGALNLLEAEISLAQGKYEEAVLSLGDTLDVTSLRARTSGDLLRGLLLLANKEGPEKAAELVAPLLEQFPDDPLLWLIHAELLFKKRQNDEGLLALQRMEQLMPNSPNGPYIRAVVLTQLGRLDAATSELAKALKRVPKHLPSLMLRANLEAVAGKHEQSIETCRLALEQNPELWQLYLLMAGSLRELERYNETVTLLSGVLQRQPKFSAAQLSLATTYNVAKQPGKALQVVRKARKTLPEDRALLLAEIQLLCSTGKADQAQEVAEKSMGESPEAGMLLAVAQTFFTQNRHQYAEAWCRRGLTAATGDDQKLVRGQLHSVLGELLYQRVLQNDERDLLNDVREQFQLALDANPNDLSSANNLAWVLATEMDQLEAAAKLLDEHFQDVPVGNLPIAVIDTLAEVYRRVGRLDRAREIIDAALEIAAGNAMLRYHHGMILADQGEALLARLDLQAALDLGLPSEKEQAAKAKLSELEQVTGNDESANN